MVGFRVWLPRRERESNPRQGDFFLALSPLDHAKGQSAQAEIERYIYSITPWQCNTICAIDGYRGGGRWASHQELSAQKRTRCTKRRPQLPCWCHAHGSERPVSKDRHRPQLCAKPPHRWLAAQRASASSLPASATLLLGNDCLCGQCWPASLAVGGSSAHLAGVRRSHA